MFSVPETATLLQTNGAVYPGLDEDKKLILLRYEVELLKLQISLEESILAISKIQSPQLGAIDAKVIILMDRGSLDIKAYVPQAIWAEILTECKVTEAELQSRYDIVCHMTSTAKGAEQYYTLDNNEARTEGIDLARQLDDATWHCWQGPPHHYAIENAAGETFDDKLQRLLFTIEEYMNII